MARYGIGASVLRKEDERFLRGRGQYVGDHHLAGTRDVAFVRSPVAHARLKRVDVPERFRGAVFTAKDLVGVKPIVSAPPLKNFKRSSEPILAIDKLRYVGEIIAMCMGRSRAEAEDIAGALSLEYEELPAVTDMLAGSKAGSPLVHEEWGDNIFVTFSEDGSIEEAAKAAAIKVRGKIRTARHCMLPMEGRGVIAYRDARLRQLTLITSTQFPTRCRPASSECLGIEHGRLRVISPDVGGGFGYKGLLCREEVALGWLAQRVDHPVRWLEDCREHLTANANCREHHYQITGYATADGKLIAIDCIAHVDAGAYSSYPISSSLEAAQIAKSPARAVCFLRVPVPVRRGRHQQMPDPRLSRGRPNGRLSRDRNDHGCYRPRSPDWNPTKSGFATWLAPGRCRSTTLSANISTAATTRNVCGGPLRPFGSGT